MSSERGDRRRDQGRGTDEAIGGDESRDGVAATRLGLALQRRLIQRKAERNAKGTTTIPQSGGAALAPDQRRRFESQLGADLSSVKVHTGGESSAAAKQLGAKAFTDGESVHFAEGQYRPGTRDGDHLLAHELAHTVQAKSGGAIARKKDDTDAEADELEVSHPDDPAEKEADGVADQVSVNFHSGEKEEEEGERGDGKADDGKSAKAGAKVPIKAAAPGIGRKVFRSPSGEAPTPPSPEGGNASSTGSDDAAKQRDEERKRAVAELSTIPVAMLPAGAQVAQQQQPPAAAAPPQAAATQPAGGEAQPSGQSQAQAPPQPTPTTPPLDRETYYVSAADAARMLRLFGVLAPDVQIRDFKKGFIVRRDGAEWYYERREDALAQGAQPVEQASGSQRGGAETQGAVAGAHPGASIGLPAPNAATVELHGFRGVRSIDGRPRERWTPDEQEEVQTITSRDPLLEAGHIGVSVDGGAKIYGFTPEFPPGTDPQEAFNRLKAHEAFPGVVKDDTESFRLAARQHQEKKWNTEVFVSVDLVDKPKKQEVAAKLKEMSGMAPGEHGESYSFPLKQPDAAGNHFAGSNGATPDHVANCAVFPSRIGVPIPEPSGNLAKYIPELAKWVEAGPNDRRTGAA